MMDWNGCLGLYEDTFALELACIEHHRLDRRWVQKGTLSVTGLEYL